MSLKPVLEALDNIGAHSARKDKERLIGQYLDEIGKDFRQVIYYTYDSLLRFKTTRVFFTQGVKSRTRDIFSVLSTLASQPGASNKDINTLSIISSIDKETVEVVKRIINKDLRCGVGIKTFKKFIPYIYEHDVMLAIHNWPRFWKTAQTWDNVCYSIKLNGVRSQAVVAKHNVFHLSRSGKEWTNFGVFDNELFGIANFLHQKFGLHFPIIFDGEVITTDIDFQRVMTQVKRLSNVDPSILRYAIFDVVDNKPLINRYEMLKKALNPITGLKKELIQLSNEAYVYLLKHDMNPGFTTYRDIEELCGNVIDEGDEGLMVKTKSGPYERKLSPHWHKMKALYIENKGIEVDLPVIGFELGTGKYKNVVGKLICNYNGVEVRVGSGLSDVQRQEFLKDTPKMIEVHADSETKDGSLCYPIFQRARDDL